MHNTHRAKPAPINHNFSLPLEIRALGDHGNNSLRLRIGFQNDTASWVPPPLLLGREPVSYISFKRP